MSRSKHDFKEISDCNMLPFPPAEQDSEERRRPKKKIGRKTRINLKQR